MFVNQDIFVKLLNNKGLNKMQCKFVLGILTNKLE